MNSLSMPKHAIIDGFLPDDDAAGLLAHAIDNPALFRPATVTVDGATYAEEADRRALSTTDLGSFRDVFSTTVETQAEQLCRTVGLAPFPICEWDIELAVHQDGGFFHEHIDTMTAANREGQTGDRVISLVYYLHRAEAAFTGGDLVLRPFRKEAGEVRIAPKHNRLVAFPSFARHEVETIHVPGNAWEDARFSVNCWLLRARD